MHVPFTCGKWVYIDDPSVPLNVISYHVNPKHTQKQQIIQVHDGLRSAAVMTAVKTHLPHCLSVSISLEFQHIITHFCTLPKCHGILILPAREAKCLGLWNDIFYN